MTTGAAETPQSQGSPAPDLQKRVQDIEAVLRSERNAQWVFRGVEIAALVGAAVWIGALHSTVNTARVDRDEMNAIVKDLESLKRVRDVVEDPAEGIKPMIEQVLGFDARVHGIVGDVAALKDRSNQHEARLGKQAQDIERLGQQLRDLDGPIGVIVAWPSEQPAPLGWHVCDGALLDLTGHEKLAEVLGASFGLAPPGKVRLPDCRGIFLRGHLGKRPEGTRRLSDLGFRFDPDADSRLASDWKTVVGNKVGSVQFDASNPNPGEGLGQDHWGGAGVKIAPEHTAMVRSHIFSGPEQAARESGSTETRPKNIAVTWIIRTE